MSDHNLTAGDLVTHGTILWEETPEYKVWMTRDGDKLIITTEYKDDVIKALMDQNQREANAFNATGSHGNLVKVASIPTGLYYDWKRQGIVDDPEAMRRRLNDSDYAKFRTNSWSL
ncbi:hypothetical protein [Neorhizobium sp. NCHU2750]|uniref:hypothetical protein n=1 Tax=Neorhizobium sp. NCHU2750 TaxID=1825976 RepID=UPI000E729379|nr:hypothetical protein NCHU2750_15290 [Neorhizobium sp. NCHU2750]